MKKYQKPGAEHVLLCLSEDIAIELGQISNPFDLAAAEDEAIEEQERQAALEGK